MKSFKFSLVFFFAFSVTIYAQSDKPKQKYDDPVPKTSKSTARDTMPEEKLWETAVNKFEHLETDSSKADLVRRIASFEGIKFQLRKNTGNLQTVLSWEYRYKSTSHGSIVLYIFTLQNKEKIIVSLRPINDYKLINFFFEARGNDSIKIPAYVPNSIVYKDITKITLIF